MTADEVYNKILDFAQLALNISRNAKDESRKRTFVRKANQIMDAAELFISAFDMKGENK